MNLASQLLLLSFAFAVGYGVLVAQVVALNRVFRKISGYYSPAWLLFGAGFALAGALRLWQLLRLPVAVMQAKVDGTLPQSFTLEQWAQIAGSALVILLIALAFDRHRRDLLKLGA